MKDVRIYTTAWCPYCHRAKRILKKQGVQFEEIKVDRDDKMRRWLSDKTGQRTVPQIFFGDDSIGGCDDLERLIATGNFAARIA